MSGLKIVEVVWLDAMTEEASLDDVCACSLSPIVRHNLGYLLKDETTFIIISKGKLENIWKDLTAWDSAMVIPRGMVVSVKELTPVPE